MEIQRYHLNDNEFFVPFPYDATRGTSRSPLPRNALRAESPLLYEYFTGHRDVLDAQTKYNARIIGAKHNTDYYALARVGDYSHATTYVAFRDNSKWQATVVTAQALPWGGQAVPVFPNHAVSISEGPNGAIDEREAHYVCAFLNAPTVARFVLVSSDSRTFPIRPRIAIPPFDRNDERHRRLSELSQSAHASWNDPRVIARVDGEVDEVILSIVRGI